jgi:adenylate kinase
MSEEIKLPNILVTGTPGVGKTSFSMLLTDNLNDRLQSQGKQFMYINIGKLITENKLYTDWNQEFDVPEYDEDKVLDELIPLLTQGGCVLDFHSSGFLPEDMIDLVCIDKMR